MIAVVHTPMAIMGAGFSTTNPYDNKLYSDGVPVLINWRTDATKKPFDDYFSALKTANGTANCPVSSIGKEKLCLVGYVDSSKRIVVVSDVFPKVAHSFQVSVGDNSSQVLNGVGRSPYSNLLVKALSAGIGILLWILLLGIAWAGAKTALTRGMSKQLTTTFLLEPDTNTYSLSKLQFYLWTAAAAYGYTVLALSRVLVQGVLDKLPDVPSSLPGIIAVSVGTTLGSAALTSTRGSKGAGEIGPNLSDLITAGGIVAVERVQFLVWTLLGVIGFVVAVCLEDPTTITSLPEIPASLMTLGGISAAGYLGGKLVAKPGPVISQATMKKYATAAGAPAAPAPPVGPAVPDEVQRAVILTLDGRSLSSDGTYFCALPPEAETQWIVPRFVHKGADQTAKFSDLDASTGKPNPLIVAVDQDAGGGTMAKGLQVVLVPSGTSSVVPGSTVNVKLVNPDGKFAVFQLTMGS